MKTIIVIISLFNVICCQTGDIDAEIRRIFNTSFLQNYEEVTPAPLEDISALPKCGEGNQTTKYICVPYHKCNSRTNTVVELGSEDGANIINVRFGDGKCDHYLDVCCQLPENYTQPTTSSPDVTQRITTTERAILRKPNVGSTEENFCGVRNIDGIGFKITGNDNNEAEFGEFPWMVAILRKNFVPSKNQSQLAICGGSLISPRIVLTAAHCVENQQANNIKIRAGEWDTQTQKERIPYQERNVGKIIIHENFVGKNLHNDIALLILDRSLVKADNVGTICLPKQSQTIDRINCFASGWGKDVFGQEGRYSAILKKIELPLVQNSDCQRALRSTRLGVIFKLHKSFICAGGEIGKDTCTGDGGSPLVCQISKNSNRYYQIGIVAWGIGCGEYLTPGVYVDVTQFRNWIDEKIKKEPIQ